MRVSSFSGDRCPAALCVLVASVFLAGGGCVAPRDIRSAGLPPPLSADATAVALASRSLADPALHEFLRANTGRVPPPWDFETLAWTAFHFHPDLELARAEWQTARAARNTAAARTNPSVTLTPGYSTNPPIGISPWFPAIDFGFLFETARKRDWRTASATAGAEAARLRVLGAAWDVRSELRRALVELAAASARLPVVEAQRDMQQRFVTVVEQRRAAGALSSADVAPARIALLRSEAAVGDASAQITRARGRVAHALGVSRAALDGVALPDNPTTIAPPMPPGGLAAAREFALRHRPDVLALLALYDAARATLETEVRRRYSDLTIGPGYQWDQAENKWSIALSLELPIFHHHEGPIAEAMARCRERAAQLTALQARIIAAIDDAAAAQPLAERQAARARDLADASHQQARRVQRRFAEGAADRLELVTAELEQHAAALVLVDAEAALASTRAQLEDALRVPFEHLDRLAAASHGTEDSLSR